MAWIIGFAPPQKSKYSDYTESVFRWTSPRLKITVCEPLTGMRTTPGKSDPAAGAAPGLLPGPAGGRSIASPAGRPAAALPWIGAARRLPQPARATPCGRGSVPSGSPSSRLCLFFITIYFDLQCLFKCIFYYITRAHHSHTSQSWIWCHILLILIFLMILWSSYLLN